MALDGIFLNFLTAETANAVVGAKVDKIHQPSKNELVFVMRTRTGMFKLYFSADANAPRFHIVENAPENPQNPPMLCMLLRKRLTGATLTAIEQQGLDRVVFFRFDATNEIGDREKLTLVAEIMSQHSNVILLDENMAVIDALKRVNSEKSSYRLVLPGALYKLPPAQNKADIRFGDIDVLSSLVLENKNSKLSGAVLKSISGVSPTLAREVSFRTCFEDKGVFELSDIEKERLKAALSYIKNALLLNSPEMTAVKDETGKPFEFSFLKLSQYTGVGEFKKYESASKLLEAFYLERNEMTRTHSRATELFKQLETVIERTSRKLSNQREDLKRCSGRDEYRIKAELITASQYSLKKGDCVYEVFDYYSNENVKIEVDPALSPSLNAQKLYKEYRKLCTAQKMLTELIEENEKDLLYLESVRDLLCRSTLEREFAEIKEELVSQDFLKSKKNGKKQMKKASLSPFEFETSDGYRVLVGRNNIQNDKLTFKTAKKGDIWLHVQKAPGSHVLLQSKNGAVSDDAIVEAAETAAFFSSVKSSTVVTVDYTDAKNIKKPNGAKPGFVVYYTYYSVNVKPKEPKTLKTVLNQKTN
ncbi:MAG: NFACT RNA binding domain-containing protein [Oscillospiraceae bacterium]|nr:NFACT RNA binding domain-containing protein [Oscillospiraceae bacterium]